MSMTGGVPGTPAPRGCTVTTMNGPSGSSTGASPASTSATRSSCHRRILGPASALSANAARISPASCRTYLPALVRRATCHLNPLRTRCGARHDLGMDTTRTVWPLTSSGRMLTPGIAGSTRSRRMESRRWISWSTSLGTPGRALRRPSLSSAPTSRMPPAVLANELTSSAHSDLARSSVPTSRLYSARIPSRSPSASAWRRAAASRRSGGRSGSATEAPVVVWSAAAILNSTATRT